MDAASALPGSHAVGSSECDQDRALDDLLQLVACLCNVPIIILTIRNPSAPGAWVPGILQDPTGTRCGSELLGGRAEVQSEPGGEAIVIGTFPVASEPELWADRLSSPYEVAKPRKRPHGKKM